MAASVASSGTANLFLDRLPTDVLDRLRPHLGPDRFEADRRHDPGEVLFPIGGLWSVVVEHPTPVETDAVGRDGAVGLIEAFGPTGSPVSAVARVTGTAFRISRAEFRAAVADNPSLSEAVLWYQSRCWQVAEVLVACERLHAVEARLAHLLLRTADRIPDPDGFPLTQATLADMLGASRQTVTTTAARFQRDGLIAYRRGVLRVADRERLAAVACDCRRLLRRLDDTGEMVPQSQLDTPIETERHAG